MHHARARRIGLVVDLGAKTLVVLVLLFAVTHTTWSRFDDKGMPARLIAYPLLMAIVPFCWWLVARRRPADRRPAYPILADLLITLPFVIDVLGNAFDLYDSIDAFDDVCHFLNWALMTAGIGVLLLGRRDLPPWIIAWLCVGFGAASAVVWEIAEYVAFVLHSAEYGTAYRDTIGDLTLGLIGSTLAAIGTAVAASRVGRTTA